MFKFIPKSESESTNIDPTTAELQAVESPSPIPPKQKNRGGLFIALGILTGFGAGAAVLGTVWYKLEISLPQSVEAVSTYAHPNTVTIVASDGTIIKQLGNNSYDQIKINQVPQHLKEAFIASEDQRFYNHNGVDGNGVLRAILSNLQAKDVVEGGSTITQQLARMVFLDSNRNLWRKMKEARIAQLIEANFTKDEILERYLNLIYLGSGSYGVADAAMTYFGKSVKDLNIQECATLAAMTPAPSLTSPFEDLKSATERRNRVIQRMQTEGYITAEEAQKALASPLITNRQPLKRFNRPVPYFDEYVEKQLKEIVPPDVLAQGGIKVQTSINLKWQKMAEEKLSKLVANSGRWQRFSQASFVMIDPRNGQIKVMVGGKDYQDNQFNRVTQAKRQPGSTFKMFVYATALYAGFSPYRAYADTPFTVAGYKPENFGDGYSGGLMTIKEALRKSVNVVAVQTLLDVGWDPIIEVAHKMGIQSELKPTYSLALGSSEVTLLELASAYGTLANNGLHIPPHGIDTIWDRTGKVIYSADTKGERSIDKDTASIMTWMLRDVVTMGTGRNAQIGRPVAGKTGTSDKARDLWFVGYIPQMVAGVWLGNDDNSPTYGMSSTAALLWGQIMRDVVQKMPVKDFSAPPKQLEGRKAGIKVKPLRGKRNRIINLKPNPNGEITNNNDHLDEVVTENRPRYQRRNRNTVVTPSHNTTVNSRSTTRNTNTNVTTPSENNTQPKVIQQPVTPRTNPDPIPQITKPKKETPVQETPTQVVPSAPDGDNIPPAPPAARKEE